MPTLFPVTKEQFFSSLESDDATPPADASKQAQALWLVEKGKWHEAHELCNEISGPAGSWIHAYLHRVEGDLGNASYWYSRAGRETPPASVSLRSEWMNLVSELVGQD